MIIDKLDSWEEVHGYFFTPGGDQIYKCPYCGDEHIYGIENLDNYKHKCEKCGAELHYPWEEEIKEDNFMEW